MIVMQLGQCGNQVGSELFSALHNDAMCANKSSSSAPGAHTKQTGYSECSIDRFFHERDGKPDQARAVLVDMETKVVHSALSERRQDKRWNYDVASSYKGKKGSGNNWANGYCKQGPLVCDEILTLVQREAEKCSYLRSFLVLMSVAGGTGSGLGAFITEKLKDTYPHVTVVNQVIWPYASGEVIVQNYNAVLTTSHLGESSDAILVSQNDQLHKVCSKLLLMKDISFANMNKVASHSLASVLQPAIPLSSLEHSPSSHSILFNRCSLSDLTASLTPHPDYKLLTIKSIPQIPEHSLPYSSFRWSGLLKHLRQMLITDSPTEEGMDWSLQSTSSASSLAAYSRVGPHERVSYPHHGVNRSLANLLILRGNQLETAEPSLFLDSNLYCNWMHPSQYCSMWCHPLKFDKYEKMCSLVSNSQSCVAPLDRVTGKAWKMFGSRAFVHQYGEYGLSEESFMECFINVEQVLKNYSSLR